MHYVVHDSDQLEPRLATLDSGQGALLQVMSVGRINTAKPAQWKVCEAADHKKSKQQPARSHKISMSSCQRFDKIDFYISLFFSWWLSMYIQGHATFRVRGMRSLYHLLWFHPPIVSLRVS